MENGFFLFKLRFCDQDTHILKYTFRRLSNANSGEILFLWLDVKDKTKLLGFVLHVKSQKWHTA